MKLISLLPLATLLLVVKHAEAEITCPEPRCAGDSLWQTNDMNEVLMSEASKETLQRADILRPALYSHVIAENRNNVQRLMRIFGTQLDVTPPEHKDLATNHPNRVSFEECTGETTDLCARRNFAKIFPRANQDAGMPTTPEAENSADAPHVYDWASFMKAASLYPVFCGDIDTSSYTGTHNADTLCKLELASIFAHNVQETGANTATNNADGSAGCNGPDCCCDDAGTHKARQALREYSELGCVQVVPQTALQWQNDLYVLKNDAGKEHGGVMKLQCKSDVMLKAGDGTSVVVLAGQEVEFKLVLDGEVNHDTAQFKMAGGTYQNLDISNWVTAELYTHFGREYDESVRNCVTYTDAKCTSTDPTTADGMYATWFPCAEAPTYYFGRGAKQLTWNYNYGAFSLAFLGDATILLNDPEILITPAGKTTPQGNLGQPHLAFVSALWFYMTPQPPKPSMSDTVRGVFGDFAAPGGEIGFGDTTNIINGAQECGGGGGSESYGSANRMAAWQYWTEFFSISAGPEASQGCGNKPADFSNPAYPMPTDGRTNVNLYWDAWWDPYGKHCKPVSYQTAFSMTPSVNAAVTYSMCQEHNFKTVDPTCLRCASPTSDRCAANADSCPLSAMDSPDTSTAPVTTTPAITTTAAATTTATQPAPATTTAAATTTSTQPAPATTTSTQPAPVTTTVAQPAPATTTAAVTTTVASTTTVAVTTTVAEPAPDNCAPIWAQCGGEGHATLCCDAGSQCFKSSKYYSQCRPSCPAGWECNDAGDSPTTASTATTTDAANTNCASAWAKCDGEGHASLCCPEGYQCFKNSKWYSQCRTSCPEGWECNQQRRYLRGSA